jgi:hypothetical protein
MGNWTSVSRSSGTTLSGSLRWIGLLVDDVVVDDERRTERLGGSLGESAHEHGEPDGDVLAGARSLVRSEDRGARSDGDPDGARPPPIRGPR